MDLQRTLRRLRGRYARLRVEALGRASWLALRPHAAGVDPAVVFEVWDAVADGMHNSNTDLTFFDGQFFLCHQTSPYHLGSSRSRLLLWRSTDARSWQLVREFKNEAGREFRDPKFAHINGRLFLYALPNDSWRAIPNRTVVTSSADGITWDPVRDVEPRGWLFWRPKTLDGTTWYVTAYWHQHGKSALLRSSDGIEWREVSRIYEGEGNDETDFEFLPDGRMLATARLEGRADTEWGSATASTLIAVAAPPYVEWSRAKSTVTRLDGPCLFPYNGRIYCIARYQATKARRVAELGGMYSRKRTSIFLVEEDGLVYLTDLPSAGDTSYAGAVIRGDEVIASYYTSPPDKDWTWVLGMFRPTNIKMARISLSALGARATAQATSTIHRPSSIVTPETSHA
jgi:hypothetical protein